MYKFLRHLNKAVNNLFTKIEICDVNIFQALIRFVICNICGPSTYYDFFHHLETLFIMFANLLMC